MAKKAIISTVTLNAIGQAIIEKGGATSPMYPKDMPTAIRSIQGGGEGRIPSGGTKGQVLSKKSNADFDLEWKTGGDMRHDEFDALKLVDDLNPENTGITQICLLLNQIKNLLKPVCIATLVSLLTFSGFSAYVETNKLVNLIGKSNVVTGVSFDGLLTGINTNGHPVSVSGGVADIIFPEGGESGGITTNAVKDIASSAAVTNAGAVASAKAYADGKFLPKDNSSYMTGGLNINNPADFGNLSLEGGNQIRISSHNDSIFIVPQSVSSYNTFAWDFNEYGISLHSYSGRTQEIAPIPTGWILYYDVNENTWLSNFYLGKTEKASDADKLDSHDSSYFATATALAQKADLAVPSAANNFAALDAQGNLQDSTYSPSSFRSSSWVPSWSQVTSKPSWIGSSKPTYTYSEVGAAPAVEGGYLPKSGGTVDGKVCINTNEVWFTDSNYLDGFYTVYNRDGIYYYQYYADMRYVFSSSYCGIKFENDDEKNMSISFEKQYRDSRDIDKSVLIPDNSPVLTEKLGDNRYATSTALSGKADKVSGTSLNNKLAALDANGNLKNSGYTASSFATPSSVTNTVNLRTPVLHISYNGSSASVTESAQEIVTAITASNQAKLLMNNLYWLQIDTYYTEQVEVGGQTYTMYNAYISGLNGVYNPFYGIISAVSDIGYKNAQITIQSYVRPSKLLSGYGITNAYTKSEASNKFLPLDGSKKMTGDLEFDSRFNTTNKISTYTTSTSEGAFTALELDSGATIRFYDGRYDKYSWLDPDGSWVITENALESWYPNSTNTFVELEDDYNTNKTAITIGSRHWDTTEEDPEPIGPRSVVVGKNCAASGENSVAIGTACYAYGTNSFSLGEACISAPYSIALGWCSSTFGDTGFDDPDYFSLTWSGDSERSGGYRSHGNGTFNINPKGGPDGFWIGDVNLSKLVDSKISPFTNKVYSADNGDMTGKAGYNVKWAMLGSSRTIIGDRSSEKINKIRFSGAWGGSRGYSAKLLVWVNNGQDPSDSSTTVYALSDNVATEANNNLPIVFEFSNGVSLPEGSRLIVSACDPSKTWNDVKNVTWSQIATTYPSGHGMRWLCGAVQDTGCRTFEENKTEIIQKRCPDAIFTIYGTCASKDDLKLLSGKSFGLSTQQEMAIAISNIIEKLGGSVTSMP